MVRMEDMHSAINSNSSRSTRQDEDKADRSGKPQLDGSGGRPWELDGSGDKPWEVDGSGDRPRELVLTWFAETQAPLILHNGRYPTWFRGFLSRQDAEDQLRDKRLGSFLIRLSEKASGYILSYKGHHRCRHFVIKQTQDSMLVVCGDCVTHPDLSELINHFTHTPIQPFGEFLTLDEEAEVPSDQLYDVIHDKSHIKSGVSVQALRNLWDERADVTPMRPPVPPKGRNRRVTSFSSGDRNHVAQVTPPVPKKNLPLRNSVSADPTDRPFPGTEPYRQPEEKWPHRRGTDDSQETGAHSCLDPCLPEHRQAVRYPSSQGRSLLHLEEDQSHSHQDKPTPPARLHTPLAPPRSVSVSSSALFREYQPRPSTPPDTTLTLLHPNPLYQTSSGLSTGHSSPWAPHSCQESGQSSKTSRKPINDTVTSENTYEDMLKHRNNSIYEGIPESQHGSLHSLETQTYEDVPSMHSNTYATVEELQPTRNTWGKKMHKWWKFLPESKKK